MSYPESAWPTRFERISPLGRGAEGEVFLVLDREAGERRALKLLLPGGDAPARERLEREFELLLALRHPNLVRAYDYGHFPDGRYFLTLEYLPGGTLESRVFPAAPADSDRWMSQLLSALDFLHSQGVLHLDLKPRNLLFDSEGDAAVLKVADFGLSLDTGSAARRAGTPGYLAPEVLRGEPAAPAADLYAVGAVAHLMYTGHASFSGVSADDLMRQQQGGSFDREHLRRHAPGLLPIVERLLSPAPAARPASVQSLLRAAGQWRNGESAGGLGGILLGRERELARLMRAVQAPGADVVLLSGPRGSGKSALLRALAGKLQLAGRAARHFPSVGALESAAPSALKKTLLLVDDLHLAAPESVKSLTRGKPASSRSARILALDEAILSGDAFARLRAAGTAFGIVRLKPLPAAVMTRLVEREFPGHGRPDLAAFLLEHAQGRPGRLAEICQELRARGLVQQDASGWRCDGDALRVWSPRPEEDSLEPIASEWPLALQRYLWVASWIGEPETRLRAGDFSPTLEPPLSVAAPRAWLRGPVRLRSALEPALSETMRAALAGEILRLEPRLGRPELAELSGIAGDPAKALEFQLQEARDSGAPEAWARVVESLADSTDQAAILDEALEAYDLHEGHPGESRALELRLELPADSAPRAECLRRLGWIQVRSRQHEVARSFLERARSTAVELPELQARILADLGWIEQDGEHYAEAEALYQQALALLSPGANQVLGVLHNRIGTLKMRMGDMAGAEASLREGLREGGLAGDARISIRCWSNLALVLYEVGRLKEAVRLGEHLLSGSFEQVLAPGNLSPIHSTLALGRRWLLEYVKFAEHAQRALRYSEMSGNRTTEFLSRIALAQSCIHLGRWLEAKAILAELPAQLPDLDRSFVIGVQAEIFRAMGRRRRAVQQMSLAFEMRRGLGMSGLAAGALGSVIEMRIEAQDRDGLLEDLLRAEELLAGPLGLRNHCDLELNVAFADLYLGREESVRTRISNLDSQLRGTDLVGLQFKMLRLKFDHAVGAGEFDRARSFLDAAQKMCRHAGAPREQAELAEAEAKLHERRGLVREARSWLAEAASQYRALGLKGARQRVLERHFEMGSKESAADGELSFEMLHDLGEMVHSISSMPELLDKSMDLLLRHLLAERCVLFLSDGEGGELRIAGARGGAESIYDAALEYSTSVVQDATRSGSTVLSGDALNDPRLGSRKSILKINILSVLCQPLMVGEKVIGAVYLDHRSKKAVFTPEHPRLLRSFCRLIAIALEQARTNAELERATELLTRENLDLRRSARTQSRTEPFICASETMQAVLRDVDRVAPYTTTTLLFGPSGSGKERLAERLHYASPRAEQPFLKFNCAAVPEQLVESEMFGIEAGAASGVTSRRIGCFEAAHCGTLFLDEIGDMHLGLQSKLLRALSEGEIRRVGSNESLQVDVRVIAATHRNLLEMVKKGEFREDLYFRIAGMTIRVPSLGERPEDILPLAEHYVEHYASLMHVARPAISPALKSYLLQHPWDGGVRELRNLIEREMVRQRGPVLAVPEQSGANRRAEPLKHGMIMWQRIQEAMLQTGGNRSRAASLLGVTEGNIRYYERKFWTLKPGNSKPRKDGTSMKSDSRGDADDPTDPDDSIIPI